jgi:hypothetical protein
MATFPNWITLDDALLQTLEPFKIAMDREEQRGSKHPDQVSKADRQRICELEALLLQAASSGNDVEVARLEQELDGILLYPVEQKEIA